MNYDTARHKMQKYESKMNGEGNMYKRALYAEKIAYYKTLSQSGGSLSDVIGDHKNKLSGDITKALTEIQGKLASGLPPDFEDKIKTMNKSITSMSTNFTNVRKEVLKATEAFADYNADIRHQLRTMQDSVTQVNPLTSSQITMIDSVADEINKLNIDSMNDNTNLMGLFGQLKGDSTEKSRSDTIAKIKIDSLVTEIDPSNTSKILKMYSETAAYGLKVLAAIPPTDATNKSDVTDLITKLGLVH